MECGEKECPGRRRSGDVPARRLVRVFLGLDVLDCWREEAFMKWNFWCSDSVKSAEGVDSRRRAATARPHGPAPIIKTSWIGVSKSVMFVSWNCRGI